MKFKMICHQVLQYSDGWHYVFCDSAQLALRPAGAKFTDYCNFTLESSVKLDFEVNREYDLELK